MRQGKAELRPVRLSGLPAGADWLQLAAMPANPREDFLPISFPGWKEALGRATLAPEVRERYRRAILTLLKRCKEGHVPVSVALIREHLAASRDPSAREVLRWFYLAATGRGSGRREAGDGERKTEDTGRRTEDRGRRSADGRDRKSDAATPKPAELRPGSVLPGLPRRGDVPPAAARDQGGADWERDLIAAARERGFLWRTEETYRMWGARFARFLAPRSPYAAGTEQVAAFLSALAVEQRASPSTQKQAA